MCVCVCVETKETKSLEETEDTAAKLKTEEQEIIFYAHFSATFWEFSSNVLDKTKVQFTHLSDSETRKGRYKLFSW